MTQLPTYHNLRVMGPGAHDTSKAFDDWLHAALMHQSGPERSERLLHWTEAPAARAAHPREDHLVPLMVAVGAAELESATCIYHEEHLFGGVVASSLRFGAVAG